MWTGTAGVVIGSIVQVFVDRRMAVSFFLCYTTSCCFCIFSIIYMVSLNFFRIAAFWLFGTDPRKRSPFPSVLSALLTRFPGRCAAQGRIQGRIPGMDFYRMDIFSPLLHSFFLFCASTVHLRLSFIFYGRSAIYIRTDSRKKNSLPLLLRIYFTFLLYFRFIFFFL